MKVIYIKLLTTHNECHALCVTEHSKTRGQLDNNRLNAK